MIEDIVVPQGGGRTLGCPICSGRNFNVFGAVGKLFGSCSDCNSKTGPLSPELTISQVINSIKAKYHQ